MKIRTFVCIIAVLLVAVTAVWAQETRGTIVGRITDSTGAIIPNAEVQVVNKAMGTTVALKTNHEGIYTAPLLLPGAYIVTVASEGFKKYIRDNVELRVADRIEVNATLELGGAEQSITVSEAAPLMGTESASMGAVITSQQIMDLPLSYGNPFALIGVSSGTGFMGSPRLDRPFEPTHIANFSMNGTSGDRSDITIDGAPATATANAYQIIASYVPPTDILAEFKVQTAMFDAAVGNTEGGVTNLSIKSGTNDFHGTGYYTMTRKEFWANDYFNNALGKDRPDFSFNRWGGSFGGPVWIPKIFNGKNKTFFMFGYEGIKDSRPRYDSTTPQVPTAAMKTGDFSSLLAANVGGGSCVTASSPYNCYQIFNPFSRKVSGSRFAEDPFPGNIVPTSLFNPVGKAILDKYYPAATSAGNSDGTNNLLQPDLSEKADYYNLTARVDQNISDRQRFYARYSMYRRNSTYDDYFHTDATGTVFIFDSYNTVADDTFVLTPTLVVDFRYGYNRFIRGSDGPASAVGFDLTKLGLPSSYNALIPATIRRFPRIDLTGYIGTGFTGEYRPVDTHSFSASLNKTSGSHAIRGGLDWRSYRETDGFFSNDQTGRFIFDTSYTKGPLDNSAAAPGSLGQAVAALLLGIPSSSSLVNRTADYAEQSMTYGLYVQDDWKISPKLTLNIGLRYELEAPLKERYNKTVQNFDPTASQPFGAAAMAAYDKNPAVAGTAINVRGGLTFATGGPLYSTPKLNFMPRFGFAYQLPKNSVVRGGFGVFNGFLGERRGDVIQTGFSRTTTFNAFASDNTTIIKTLSNPWTDGILEPVGSSQGAQTNVGQAISFFNQSPLVPKNMRWQLDVQHEFKGNLMVEAAYVGNKGIRIELTRNLNALPLKYLSTLGVRDNTQNAYVTASVANPFNGLTMPLGTPTTFTATTISRQQMLLPFPEYGAINTTTNEGYSWYHGLQLRAEKRFSGGLSAVGNYTYSKFQQATELLNAADPAPTRMISDQDVPHRFTATAMYQLPFGKGKKLDAHNGIVNRLIGGWEATTIWSFQSGSPLALGSYSATSATNNGDFFFSGSPLNPVLSIDQRAPARWFDTTAFVTASSAQPVSHLRVNPYRFAQLRGQRTDNVDFSLIKDTYVTERIRGRFSVQALNGFNHVLFPTPNLTPTSNQFGVISASTQNNYPRRLQLEFKLIF